MYNLFVSTVDVRHISFLLSNNACVVASEDCLSKSDLLPLAIEVAVGDVDLIDSVFLNVGPGSFTGVRAGISYVAGLTVLLPNISVYVIDSMDLLCVLAEISGHSGDKVLSIRSRVNQHYVKICKGGYCESVVLSDAELVSLCVGIDCFSSDMMELSAQNMHRAFLGAPYIFSRKADCILMPAYGYTPEYVGKQ